MKKLSQENKKVIERLLLSLLIIGALILAVYLICRHYGITTLTQEQLRDYISSTGVIAPLIYMLITFAQVTIVPIPGAVTIIAGSYVFGFFEAFIYSYIAMMIGSVASFALGRGLGRPYVNWVAGSKEKADEWIAKLKGRENVFLFFAFLLPLFPDDILCAVAGTLPVKWATFMIMQFITRATSILATLIFMSGEIIPFEGWGLVVIGFLAIIALTAFILSLKHAEKLNEIFSSFINKLTRKNKN